VFFHARIDLRKRADGADIGRSHAFRRR